MYQRIVVPLDGSKLAEGVLEHVRALAHCMGSEVVLMRVMAYPAYDYLLTDPGISASLREQLEQEACSADGEAGGEKITSRTPDENSTAEGAEDAEVVVVRVLRPLRWQPRSALAE